MRAAPGAHSGTVSWLLQRASAVLLAIALPALAIYLIAALPLDYAGWRALFAPVGLRVVLMLTAVALALHAWIGLRDILMDYVHPLGLRLALYLVLMVLLAGSVGWLAFVLGDLA